ncbi:GYD domain-containing protein [Pseudomonas zhanjiangensis]|uniref:GYD domain-containing protein n=1 Tax=Pseudomonas zhanjiangensis TaxID=3239015 RepID=A0ABV3YQ44_9PSED
MATYIMLSQAAAGTFASPQEFKRMADDVSERIKRECPDVIWGQSFSTLGQFDVVDIIESDDPLQVEKAAMIIRAYGKANTQTLVATPWRDFLAAL